MTQPAKSQEPSMEEILASIRRIIADDDATKSVPQAQEAPKPAAPAARPAVLPPRAPPAPPPRVAPPVPSPVEAMPAAAAEDSGDVEDQSSDILELTESMAAPMPAPPAAMPGPASQFRTIDGNSDVDFDDAPERPAPQANQVDQTHLISKMTSAAVDSAFNSLAQTVLVQNARTLEDLVREMLRPMLKTWLDENLPGMVERLVRAEIERVSRGR
jgi:cell pole-organizing protein PopZ